jgi:pimeloyl-ACP methyl ester carboxylesterase
VVFVHGFSLDRRMWDDQIEDFARRYRVIRYDVRGYGRSAVPGSEGYYHADDLVGLVDYLGIEKAHIVGLSLGAAIAAEFVLAYTERASSLVAVDPVIWGYRWSPEYGASLGALWQAGRESGVQAATALWLRHPMFAPALERPEVAERLLRIINDYSGWHWTHDDPGLLPERRAFDRLEEISVPTLTMVGERDMPDFHVITDALKERIPRARKIVLPRAGHMSNMEAPGEFNAAVLSFLGG